MMVIMNIVKKNIKSDLSNLIYLGVLAGFILQLIGMNIIAKSFPDVVTASQTSGFVETVVLGKIIAVKTSQSYAAGLLSVFLLLFGALTAGKLASERENNTLMRIYATPVTKSKILLSFIISTGFINLLITAILIGFCSFVLEIEWGNSIIGIGLITLTGVFVSVSISFMFSVLFKTAKTAIGVLLVIVIVMTFFSAPFDPYRTGNIGLTSLMQKLTINHWLHTGYVNLMAGEPFSSIFPHLLILTSLGVIASLIAFSLYRKENFYE